MLTTLSDVCLAYTSYFSLLHIKTNAELHSQSRRDITDGTMWWMTGWLWSNVLKWESVVTWVKRWCTRLCTSGWVHINDRSFVINALELKLPLQLKACHKGSFALWSFVFKHKIQKLNNYLQPFRHNIALHVMFFLVKLSNAYSSFQARPTLICISYTTILMVFMLNWASVYTTEHWWRARFFSVHYSSHCFQPR